MKRTWELPVAILSFLIVSFAGAWEAGASMSPHVADFGDVREGETKTLSIPVTNHDDRGPMQVLLILEEAGVAGFILKNSMLVLQPGETKKVKVLFSPAGEGRATERMTVNYLGGRIPEAVLLKANGLPHLGGGRNEPGRSTRP